MKRVSFLLPAIASVAAVFALVACGDGRSEPIKVNEAKTERMIESWRQNLDQISDDIEALAKDAKNNTKEGANDLVENLRAMREKLRAKISNAGDASENAWDDVKRGVESGWNELKNAVAEAKSKIG